MSSPRFSFIPGGRLSSSSRGPSCSSSVGASLNYQSAFLSSSAPAAHLRAAAKTGPAVTLLAGEELDTEAAELRPVVARATITVSRSPSRTKSLRQAVVLGRGFMAGPLRGVLVPGGSSHLRGRSGSREARGARSRASDRLREAVAPWAVASAVLVRRSCESGVAISGSRKTG